MAKQLKETFDETIKTEVISSDSDDDKPKMDWHQNSDSDATSGESSDADFIDDSELDPNVNITEQASVLDQLDESLKQQFQTSANFSFDDFRILLETLITDVASQYKNGAYLDKINRPHHYKNHESEHFAMNRVQDQITRASSNLKSGAWNERTCYLLMNYPKMESEEIRQLTFSQAKNKIGQNCDICRRHEGRSVLVTLSGKMYRINEHFA